MPDSTLRVGWAYEAYPDTGYAQMLGDMRRMRDAGANSIWIGHNNPGEVDAHKVEPGLSYVIYNALQNGDPTEREEAQLISDGVNRALRAARATGLKVVLPVGYQIMMGEDWNRQHPDSLRKTADGSPLQIYNSGVTASPYSTAYRTDIVRYYQWIQNEWVAKYADTIEMLSLSDEPLGGDYSDSAKEEFARRYKVPMDSLLLAEEWKIGEFEAGVIADFASWDANEWKKINPALPVTISFDGAAGRRQPGLPEMERLFSETPDNFVVSFDAYLHDDLPNKPVTPEEISQLKLFLTTIGYYSRIYDKSLSLWAGVNAWGLAQASTAPRGIADAVTNQQLLLDLPRRAGGKVRGIYAWNYNLKQQGLYNYSLPTTFDPQYMEIAVDRAIAELRGSSTIPFEASADAVVILSPRALYQRLAETRSSDLPPEWFETANLGNLLKDRTAVLATSPASLSNTINAPIFVCLEQNYNSDPEILPFLQARVKEGKIVLTSESVARALGVPYESWSTGLNQLPTRGGVVYAFGDLNALQ